MTRDALSPAQARRTALAAQGLGRPVAEAAGPRAVGARQLHGVVDRLGLLQIDSVNVFERSHHLPVFARLGHYDRDRLDELLFAPRGRYVEYWAHEAALLPVETWPLMRWRMDDHRARAEADPGSWLSANARTAAWLLDELRGEGPLPASLVEHDANRRTGPWWGWSDVKRGLEALFRVGALVSAGRRRFERVYALPEQVLPAELLAVEVGREEAHRRLLAHAARASGVATTADLADHWRMKTADVVPALHDLADQGVVTPVTVPGWPRGGWLHRDAAFPRRIAADALLSPFDPVVWTRPRAERLFGFRYRIEIYTPQEKRVHGYYVLPVLQGDQLVARVDLKSDRQARVLRVQASWRERDLPVDVDRLAALLGRAARWQGLERVEVVDRGDLAAALRGAVGAGDVS
ncbi:winged helix-turn-helix domain-containing protein [Frigoribacterium sp. NBH87]|uniref:winged helix-turn-helix domain-containing protein n=1 Tax=Frigoribacterium sp. NBH87 TaxID=2596916 RepID=UPI0016263067|nr:crosslink repair DNA glycosylase YcaQ family protein [Frigoribacterium sp. NBH87]QNE43305.1 winged helix-turn-helix domain-containing protein [Frigoribacterium sp. NBH87]